MENDEKQHYFLLVFYDFEKLATINEPKHSFVSWQIQIIPPPSSLTCNPA